MEVFIKGLLPDKNSFFVLEVGVNSSTTFIATTNIFPSKTNYDISEYFTVSFHSLRPQVAYVNFFIVSSFLRSIIKKKFKVLLSHP